MANTILRIAEVKRRVGLSRTEIYNRMKLGTFPHHVKLGPRAVGWAEDEVNDWIAKLLARPASKISSRVDDGMPAGTGA